MKSAGLAAEPAPAAAPAEDAATGAAPAPGGKPSRDKVRPAKRGRPRRVRSPRFEDADDADELDRAVEPETGLAVLRRKRGKRRGPAALKRRKKRKRKDAPVRPSPPLTKTDPLKDYLAGRMVPCPVGCGGFSEVVRVGTLEKGAGEVWFECLSCAQRRQFVLPKASRAENAGVAATEEDGRETICPRHQVPVGLRRRGRQFVCPSCGVVFTP